MGKAQGFAGTGAVFIGDTAGAAPGLPQILRVDQQDTSPAADGTPRKRITVSYTPPDPIGTFTGLWCYLDAPDSAGALTIADGTMPADGSTPDAGPFDPADIGYFAFSEDSAQFSFEFKAPGNDEPELWRLYIVPVSERRHPPVIQAGKPGASVSKQFVCLPPAAPFAGREVAPLVTNPHLVAAVDLGWTSNPLQVTGESGDQGFAVVVDWEWPEGDQNFQALGGVNIVLDDGTTRVYIGNVPRTQAPRWQSQQLPLRPGTTAYTVYLISYDVRAINNSLRSGVTPAVEFSMTRQLGPAGREYAALALSNGVDAFVTATAIAGADGTSLLRITGNWTAPSDPQFGGAEIVVKKPDGKYYTVAAGRVSPIEADISQPASVQSWRFYLRSVDVNGRRNSIFDDGDGSPESGETPWVDISVGNANGQLNLAKARSDTFSAQFEISAGAFRVKEIDAGIVNTGILQVGGGGGKVSIVKIFDTLGSLIGWAGDDTGSSGFVGGWFKQFRIGGTSPSTAKIVADSAGNLTISTSLLVGTFPASSLSGLITNGQLDVGIALSKLANGTLPGGVIYAGTVAASQILGGTISAAITMTSPSLVISGGGVTVNIDATNFIKLTLGSTSVQLLYDGLYVTTSGVTDAVLSSAFGLRLFNTSSVIRTALDHGRLRLMTSAGTTVVEGGISGTDGFVRFNGTHYALWAGSNKKKVVAGVVQCVGGSVTVNTGLASIDAALATIASGGTPAEYIGTSGFSGGSVTFYNSGGVGSNPFINYLVFGGA